MEIFERALTLPRDPAGGSSPYETLADGAREVAAAHDAMPLRIVAVRTTFEAFHCEVSLMQCDDEHRDQFHVEDPFAFRRRRYYEADSFDAALMVPTGVGAAYGGEAGDATPTARLLGAVCDRLVLHPNVVNASDINEMPANALYVEGSVLTRLLCGTVALRPVRANRVLVVAEETEDSRATNLAVNATTAALATLGVEIVEIVRLQSTLAMETTIAESGRASGVLRGVDAVLDAVASRRGTLDAVAITSLIATPGDVVEFVLDYFHGDDAVNPWGGVEALLTHTVALATGLPTAHAPMGEWVEHSLDVGPVDPRKAAEAASKAFLFCTLKGLARSPQIVELEHTDIASPAGTLGVENIGALVLPSGCFGLGVAAAIEQEIPLIEVEDPGVIMDNDLASIVDGHTRHFRVGSYAEACGVLVALREGLSIGSIRRPLSVPVSKVLAGTAAPAAVLS